jgi:hypothetical protein
MARPDNKHLFVSYARPDVGPVTALVAALRDEYRLRALPVDVWMDSADLQPGEHWERAIQRALLDSFGLLIFISRNSMRSPWVRTELVAAATTDRFVVPVMLERVTELPEELAQRQWIDLTGEPTPARIRIVADQIAQATDRYLATNPVIPPVPQAEAPALAKDLADQV